MHGRINRMKRTLPLATTAIAFRTAAAQQPMGYSATAQQKEVKTLLTGSFLPCFLFYTGIVARGVKNLCDSPNNNRS